METCPALRFTFSNRSVCVCMKRSLAWGGQLRHQFQGKRHSGTVMVGVEWTGRQIHHGV